MDMTEDDGDPETADMIRQLRRLERAARPLEPGAGRRKRLRTAVVASAERFLRSIDTIHAFEELGDSSSRLLERPISEHGVPIEDVVRMWEHDVVQPGANPASGAYLAYIPGGAIYHSALGDYLAAVTNKYSGIFFTGPGPVRMENVLIRWAADLVGYPATAGGNTASGGSIANLIAITAARDAHGLRGADYATAVAYITTQTHHCIEKALRIAGLAEVQLRRVDIDERYRMRADALAHCIAGDRAQGLRPWLIAATAGSTDTGAVDPLADIADIASREKCWFHVDAAYGGFFLMTDHGRRLLAGIERSDSVVLDPHKSLFLPWGSGMVLARDVRTLAASNSYSGHYMQDALRDAGDISPADVSPELTRHFRAVRMWLPLLLLGTRPFAAALDEKLLLARYFHQRIQAAGFEVGPQPDLSVVTFRLAPRGTDPHEADRLNRAIVDGVRRDGRVFLSSTILDGRYTLRLAALSFRTHRRAIDLAVRILREQAELCGARP
ncbi:aminotransferase class I/II-fold pyridoxal phosphate-dependent enzyme [soil metagenome]